jgi:hypothetical protein
MIGRAMSDVQKMHGSFLPPETEGEFCILKGSAPVKEMRNYQREVLAYTKGHGRFFCTLKGYGPCHNAEEVIAEIGYDSETDVDNPTGSVFCSHGAGFLVPWHEVEQYMHTESYEKQRLHKQQSRQAEVSTRPPISIGDEEIEAIFQRTFGANRKEAQHGRTVYSETSQPKKVKKQEQLPEVLLVDGYNIIFAWDDLKDLAEVNIEGARGKLMDILCNFQGYRKNIVILVFDGYKVPGNPGEVIKYHNIYVVYTKDAETAD